MFHKRRALLNDLRNQVLGINRFAGCWIQRKSPSRNAWPSVTIYFESEQAEITTIHAAPRNQLRTLLVGISVWRLPSQDAEQVEIDLDADSLAIESALHSPSAADDCRLMSTDVLIAENDQGDIELYELKLTYQIIYRTNEFNPQPN